MCTLAKSDDQGLHCLLRQTKSSEKEIQLIYKVVSLKLIISNQKEEYFSPKRVKIALLQSISAHTLLP